MQSTLRVCSRCTVLRNQPAYARTYARRHPAYRTIDQKADTNPFQSSNLSHQGDDVDAGEQQIARNGIRRWLSPGKLAFYVLLGFGGYRLYIWQTNPARSRILNPKNFSPFLLETRDKVSPTSAVLNLISYPAGQNGEFINAAWRTGCWSVEIIQPELQIKRNYTPLPPSDGSPMELMRLFVREEPNGEVSRFLHQINPGTIVHMRGPYLEYVVPDDIEEIIFLAGGTGIAPALQVAHCLFKARDMAKDELPRMRILWANRRREDSKTGLEPEDVQQFRRNLWARIRGAVTNDAGVKQKQVDLGDKAPRTVVQTQLVEQVEDFVKKSDGRVRVDYFVDEEGSYVTEPLLRSLLKKTPESLYDGLDGGNTKKRLILLSGPDGFVEYFAGPKQWSGGRQVSGPLGGLLFKINADGWDVSKL
ncbi:uncharacterized protein KY384_003600 [Bacidia gigantensis]|uniref:uncharacterized protein n=1 Tax=Bacidia gigantensis TaxID=2732470 RepID=UPI001D04005C|nr:uncharacterized protein KY384_003600 [Bacidia gigantensis]KAG8531964.1 hypothetical protein KY384_003600 [Bacidia gigantensis]